jgi:hypothetical protein
MVQNELVKRFQRFRQEYLDTPEGREHRQNQLQEQQDVQEIFEELCAKQQQGADVTDEVLKRLLPYTNTEGNRARGNRVSTWPCISKDIRAWFEGTKWKTSSEWPDTAQWLLDIAEAGQRQDWEKWRILANKPIRRGFACGFITPIVHCLNPTLPVINSKVVETYKQVAHELGISAEISPALSEYPQNQQTLLELVKKLAPLGIQDLLEWDMYCHWNISKRLGGSVINVPHANGQRQPELLPPPKEEDTRGVRELCDELRTTQHNTESPVLFEKAIADAFRALGFHAEHIGGPGDTDVDAHALLGDQSFSLVIDAKTSQPGKPRGNINYAPLKSHQEQHEADYALVVAPAFAGGDTITFAERESIGLLETGLLIQLVEETARSGISLYTLKDIFGKAGLLKLNLDALSQSRCDMLQAMKAVIEVFEIHQRRDETSASLKADSIYWMLKGKGDKYPEQHIDHAVDLLANPLVGILEKKGEGYVLTLPASKAFARLASISEALSSISVDSPLD